MPDSKFIVRNPRVWIDGEEVPVAEATITLTRVDFDHGVDELVDEAGGFPEDAPWFCVRTDPFPCPAEGCDFVAFYMTSAHRIVVWPRKDDLRLLRRCDEAARGGRNPRIVEYEPGMGSCIPYDLWIEIGRPYHGMLPRPEGHRPADF